MADKSKSKVEEKKAKADENQESIKELTETLQRLQADFENYKKRVEKEKQENINSASRNIITKLLPILDNFELALKADKNSDDFVKGIELIYSELFEILENEGLKRIEATNKEFDPYLHEALLVEESDKENIVLEELQKGYMLNGKVIRHTKVKVSKTNPAKTKEDVKDDNKANSNGKNT
ncbi:nucleotide exchange factor GrpE [Candidatus Woesearchaeota archaeon]|nr:nucleotide exchange factor GrpE [Candidatus Woesearchaeota archaeon]